MEHLSRCHLPPHFGVLFDCLQASVNPNAPTVAAGFHPFRFTPSPCPCPRVCVVCGPLGKITTLLCSWGAGGVATATTTCRTVEAVQFIVSPDRTADVSPLVHRRVASAAPWSSEKVGTSFTGFVPSLDRRSLVFRSDKRTGQVTDGNWRAEGDGKVWNYCWLISVGGTCDASGLKNKKYLKKTLPRCRRATGKQITKTTRE